MVDVYYDAFISYSTQDTEFVTKIRLMLELSGRRVWQDIKDIELTDQWWAQIKAGIAASDNFLFVVSPRAMASPICHLELEHARQLKKRVIIIRYESADPDTSTKAMVERILTQNYLKTVTSGRDMFGVAEKNWRTIEAEQNISITSDAEMLNKVPKLIEAFDKDLLYIRQGNILLGRATEWQESGQNPSFLLVGEALNAAEKWRDAGKRPAPTADHLAYITASRAAEDARERLKQEQETRTRRLRRASWGAALIGIIAVIIAAGAVVVSLQANESARLAEQRESVANAQVAVVQVTLTRAASDMSLASQYLRGNIQGQTDSNKPIFADNILLPVPANVLLVNYSDSAHPFLLQALKYTEENNNEAAINEYKLFWLTRLFRTLITIVEL